MKKWVVIAILVMAVPIAICEIADRFFYFSINGSDSMGDQYIGSWQITNPFETPVIGDVVGFICLSKEKCGERYGYEIDHRWVSTDPDGCMHIVGDNPKYDWSKYYCFYHSEIKMLGVNHVLF